MIKIGLFIALFVYCAQAFAGDEQADVSIEVTIQPIGVMPPGTEGTIGITITNFGPAIDAGLFRWRPTNNGSNISYPPIVFTGGMTGPCGVSPIGQPPPGDNFGLQLTPDLLPGENVTCTYDFQVEETKILNQIGRWDVVPPRTFNDPDESNNEDEVMFVFSVLADTQSVPSISRLGLLILTILLGFIVIRRIS